MYLFLCRDAFLFQLLSNHSDSNKVGHNFNIFSKLFLLIHSYIQVSNFISKHFLFSQFSRIVALTHRNLAEKAIKKTYPRNIIPFIFLIVENCHLAFTTAPKYSKVTYIKPDDPTLLVRIFIIFRMQRETVSKSSFTW